MKTENDFPVLLLRGMLRERRHWGVFTQDLQRRLTGRKVIALDLPGNGRLFDKSTPQTIPGMTESFREQLSALQITGQLNIVALSMGGMIAIDWMIRYPDEIKSSILVNTSIRPFSPFFKRLRWQSYLALFRFAKLKIRQREEEIFRLTSNASNIPEKLINNWVNWYRECPVSSGNAYKQIRAASNFTVSQAPQQPLLLLNCRKDRLVHPDCSIKLAEAWSSPCIEHPSAGHDLPLDDPEWVIDKIEGWLGQS